MAQHFETTDIFKGAFLLSKGGDLSGIHFNERRIATFAIHGKGLDLLDREYRTGNALVNPVILRESLNHLRDVLFEMRDRRNKNERASNHRPYQKQRRP